MDSEIAPGGRLIEVGEHTSYLEKAEHLVKVMVMVSIGPISRRHLTKKGIELKTDYDDVWFEGQATRLGTKKYFEAKL